MHLYAKGNEIDTGRAVFLWGHGNYMYEKYDDKACGFGGDGLEGTHFDKWYDVSSKWCRDRCESVNGQNNYYYDDRGCVGYDYDSDKDRCRIFYQCPYNMISKDDVTCWLDYRWECSLESTVDTSRDENENDADVIGVGQADPQQLGWHQLANNQCTAIAGNGNPV